MEAATENASFAHSSIFSFLHRARSSRVFIKHRPTLFSKSSRLQKKNKVSSAHIIWVLETILFQVQYDVFQPGSLVLFTCTLILDHYSKYSDIDTANINQHVLVGYSESGLFAFSNKAVWDYADICWLLDVFFGRACSTFGSLRQQSTTGNYLARLCLRCPTLSDARPQEKWLGEDYDAKGWKRVVCMGSQQEQHDCSFAEELEKKEGNSTMHTPSCRLNRDVHAAACKQK